MKGTYEVKIYNSRISFTIKLERNITVIRGDSATGKTTFVEMLQSFEQYGRSSGVTVQCSRPCRVLTSVDWEYRLGGIDQSIVFLDEGNEFVKSEAFARAVRSSTNYFVIITRENLYQLPYSVKSILKLKTTNRRAKTYVRSYPIYDHLDDTVEQINHVERIVTEDSNSGHEMFSHIAQQNGIVCVSAMGKSNVFGLLADHPEERMLVIADGAAFGAELEKIHRLLEQRPNKIILYLPESFEWLILRSGILGNKTPTTILRDPSVYIESERYFSWEQFFTMLLTELTAGSPLQYNKRHLNSAYLHSANVEKVLDAMAEEG